MKSKNEVTVTKVIQYIDKKWGNVQMVQNDFTQKN